MPFLAGLMTGAGGGGALSVTDLTVSGTAAVAGAITSASLTATGNVIGAIVRGTTALEFPTTISPAVGVRCTDDTDTGLARISSNEARIYAGGADRFIIGSALTVDGGVTSLTVNSPQTNASSRVLASRTVDIAAVGSTVAIAGASVVELTLSAGAIVSTAAPFIADGANGQVVWLINMDATDTLTLSDDGATASNLRLRAATRALAPLGGYLQIRFSTTSGFWQEIAFG